MSAILHCVITSIENDRISRLLENWRNPIKIAKEAKDECKAKKKAFLEKWWVVCGIGYGNPYSYSKQSLKDSIARDVPIMEIFFPKVCEECEDRFTQDRVLTLVEPGDDEACEYSGNGQWVERTFCKNGCWDCCVGKGSFMWECWACKCIAHKKYWDHENNCCGRCAVESESDSDSD